MCIISIMTTVGMKDRRGTEVDCRNLKKLFNQLQFSVRVFEDDSDLSADVSPFN